MLISKDNTILKHAKRYTRQTDYETLTAKQTNAACASLPIISTMSKNKKSSPRPIEWFYVHYQHYSCKGLRLVVAAEKMFIDSFGNLSK